MEWDNIAMIIFIVGSVAACFLGIAMLNGELTNLETLIAEALFGTTLALYILRLQKKDTDALNRAVNRIDEATGSIKEIARDTAEMIAEERGRQAKRKKHCLDFMKSWLRETKYRHESLLAVCNRLASQEVEEASKKNFSELTRMDHEWVKLVAIPNYRSCVMQISDLLSENYLSTYGLQEIENLFTSLLDPNIVYANPEKLKRHIDDLTYKRGTSDFFLEQVEKEMPDKF